mgnify:FL=1
MEIMSEFLVDWIGSIASMYQIFITVHLDIPLGSSGCSLQILFLYRSQSFRGREENPIILSDLMVNKRFCPLLETLFEVVMSLH